MADFKYCIWALPEYDKEWYNYANGFYPHITIKKYMSLDDAYLYFQKAYFQSIEIYLSDCLTSFITDYNFYGLYYDVYTKKNPSWWPIDAHISFCYRYNKPFDAKELDFFSNKIQNKIVTINKFMLVRCDGHFLNWKNQIVDIYTPLF